MKFTMYSEMHDEDTFYQEFSHIEERQNTASTFTYFGDDFSMPRLGQPLNNQFMTREYSSSDDGQYSTRTLVVSPFSVNGCDEYRSPTPHNILLVLPKIDVFKKTRARDRQQPTFPVPKVNRPPSIGINTPRIRLPSCASTQRQSPKSTSKRHAYRRNPRRLSFMTSTRHGPEADVGHYNKLPPINNNFGFSHFNTEKKTESSFEQHVTGNRFYQKTSSRHYEHTAFETYSRRMF